VATPPGAENPPVLRLAATTRWHGTMMGTEFLPMASPTPRVGLAEPRCDGAVGEGRAWRNGAGDGVDPPVELGDAVEVERNVREIARLAAQECHNAVDGVGDQRWRGAFKRLRMAPGDARAQRGFAPLVKPYADNAARAPCDGAAADCGVEQGKGRMCHGEIIRLLGIWREHGAGRRREQPDFR
jgi:hypothetical protein